MLTCFNQLHNFNSILIIFFKFLDDIKQEGVLSRKHEYESIDRKASNRSWDKVYCVVNSNRFEFYKDQKHFKNVSFFFIYFLFKSDIN